ncbi:MAG: energy-coupling factor transporter transmembrane component T [Lactimicrobium massiliense]|nr:energy-coupling factor transporter transmembrane component T [Lactimicrobium massiliense]MDD6675866.1 energy-coupling factor transporter transmembrane component T [Lactimicrobium massiliense]
MRTFAEKLNPSIKLITILILVILISFQYRTMLNLSIFVFSLLLVFLGSHNAPKKVLKILIPAFFAAFGLFMMGLYYARGSSVTVSDLSDVSSMPYVVRAAMSRNLTTALQLSTRLLAFAGLGIYFALTTNGEYFVRSLMHQCHMSPKFAYGMLAAFHLLPHMADELKSVQLAYRVRGMHVSFLSRRVLFTMLVNSIHWSESLAMAMESKGFDGDAPRTWCEIPEIHLSDILLSVFSVAAVVTAMVI